MRETPIERAETLLKATRDMLEKADSSRSVIDVMSETVFYDEAECDGTCLLEDIRNLLDRMAGA